MYAAGQLKKMHDQLSCAQFMTMLVHCTAILHCIMCNSSTPGNTVVLYVLHA